MFRMIRAGWEAIPLWFKLLGCLALASCGQWNNADWAAHVAAMERANAELVSASASSCGLRYGDDVFAVGAHSWDFTEDFAESDTVYDGLGAQEVCMVNAITVHQAAQECGLWGVVYPQDGFTFGFPEDYVADRFTSDRNRCMNELLGPQQQDPERALIGMVLG